MNNVIQLSIASDEQSGADFLVGMWDNLYLGSKRIGGALNETLTAAIRSFNLPNAVAPGEWPSAHEGVTTDGDPRHHGDEPEHLRDPELEAYWSRRGV